MTNSSALTHASVGNVRAWFSERESGIDDIQSSDILKALFGISGVNPSPVDITDQIVKAGGNEFRSVLVNKYAKGDLWEFTTDFHATVKFSKVLNEQGTGYMYHLDIVYPELRDGVIGKVTRPLVQYNARGVNYFTVRSNTWEPDEEQVVEEPKPSTFSFTTDTQGQNDGAKESEPVVDPTPETAITLGSDSTTPASESLETPAAQVASEETIGGDGVERESMTVVSDLDDDEIEDEDDDMTTEKITAFTHSLVQNLKEAGNLTDETVLKGFQIVFNNDVTFLRDKPGKITMTVVDEGRSVSIELDDWDYKPPVSEAEATSEKKVTLIGKTIMVDGVARVRESNKILMHAHKLIDDGECKNLIELEDKLNDAYGEQFRIECAINDDEIVVTTFEHDEAGEPVQPGPVVETPPNPPPELDRVLIKVGQTVEFVKDGDHEDTFLVFPTDSPEPVTSIVDHNFPAHFKLNTPYIATQDITPRLLKGETLYIADAFLLEQYTKSSEPIAESDDNVNESEPETKVSTIYVKGTTDEEFATKAKNALISNADGSVSLPELIQIVSDATNSLVDIEYNEDDEAWTITLIPEPTEDPLNEAERQAVDKGEVTEKEVIKLNEATEEAAPYHMEEPEVTTEEMTTLETEMASDKGTEPVYVDPNYIDLSDREMRDRVIQVLFPGVTDPAITHLLNFLRDYHTEEETKSYLETKGTFPTETCIVYSNITFSIVKMKDGRFWRIFAANTDYGLEDHTWMATKYIQDRWYQLGHDISNTTDYVRENKSAGNWRRKNNNF